MEKFEQKEKESLVQLMPTAAIEYLKEHNVYEDIDGGKPASKTFRELTRSKGEKCEEINPLFNTSVQESLKEKVQPPELAWGFDEVKRYLQWKKGKLPDIEKDEVEHIKGAGPYSHGEEFVCTFGGGSQCLVRLRGLPNISAEFLVAGATPMHSLSQKIMVEVDSGRMACPVFEKLYLEIVENFLVILPRMLTLLARNPKWNLSEMDAYLKSKHIEKLPFVWGEENQDLHDRAHKGVRYMKQGDMEKLEDIMRVYAGAYQAIREYLESKVKYKDEEDKI
jgi:hypothetical protein